MFNGCHGRLSQFSFRFSDNHLSSRLQSTTSGSWCLPTLLASYVNTGKSTTLSQSLVFSSVYWSLLLKKLRQSSFPMHKGVCLYIFTSLICTTCSHFFFLKPTTSTFTIFFQRFFFLQSFNGRHYSHPVFDILRLRKIQKEMWNYEQSRIKTQLRWWQWKSSKKVGTI